MKKVKLFVDNFLVYGIGGIISKIIPLIMVPIITRIMPNSSYFGISDMQNTLVSFCSAFAIFGMYDAMYRMFFEKSENEFKIEICSTTFIFTLIMSTTVSILMVLFRDPLARIFFKDESLCYLVYIAAITTFVSGTNSIVAAPTRIQNKRKIFLIMNTVGPVLSYGISVPLLLSGYYYIALPLAALFSGIFNEVIFWRINRHWFKIKQFSKQYLIELLKIAIPLVPNFLIYWVFNSSDKLMITQMIGTKATGLYSVGSKLGLASQLIYTAFAGGWQYFAFTTMNDKDQVKSNSNIFEYLGIISYICTSLICLFAHLIYTLLFTGNYIDSYIVAPYLFLAPLLQMLFQVESNQFLVIKKTWPNMLILSTGAVANVILNYLLIPILGIEGAAIATLVGYTVSDIICTLVLIRLQLMVISKRFILCSLIMIAFIFIWRILTLNSFFYSLVATGCLITILIYLYKRSIRSLANGIRDSVI
jgi:O-antigen/teichoic acid export membrane protein